MSKNDTPTSNGGPSPSDYTCDLIFLLIYCAMFVILGFVSVYTLKHKQNRNAYILLTIIFIFLLLIGNDLVISRFLIQYILDRIMNLSYFLITDYK